MSIVFATLLLSAPPALPAPTASAATVTTAKAQLADLAWMTGRWTGEAGKGSTIEETWNESSGESMVGSFRMVGADGRVRFYEILVLLQTAEGPEMRIRHFDRLLMAKEEKDAPMVFRLAESAKNRAVFEIVLDGVTERIVYAREKDALSIRVEKPGKHSEFKMHLAR